MTNGRPSTSTKPEAFKLTEFIIARSNYDKTEGLADLLKPEYQAAITIKERSSFSLLRTFGEKETGNLIKSGTAVGVSQHEYGLCGGEKSQKKHAIIYGIDNCSAIFLRNKKTGATFFTHIDPLADLNNLESLMKQVTAKSGLYEMKVVIGERANEQTGNGYVAKLLRICQKMANQQHPNLDFSHYKMAGQKMDLSFNTENGELSVLDQKTVSANLSSTENTFGKNVRTRVIYPEAASIMIPVWALRKSGGSETRTAKTPDIIDKIASLTPPLKCGFDGNNFTGLIAYEEHLINFPKKTEDVLSDLNLKIVSHDGGENFNLRKSENGALKMFELMAECTLDAKKLSDNLRADRDMNPIDRFFSPSASIDGARTGRDGGRRR